MNSLPTPPEGQEWVEVGGEQTEPWIFCDEWLYVYGKRRIISASRMILATAGERWAYLMPTPGLPRSD